MIEKKEHYNHLLDVYGSLLTEHQKEICRLYYEEDLSLQEIAENYGISRNAVFDNIKRVENLLEDYENKLSLIKKETNEQKKKFLIQLIISSLDLEKIEFQKNYQVIELADEMVKIEIVSHYNQVEDLIKKLTNNISQYEINIYKLEKEIRK